jgi:hypothetical protein
MVNALSLRCCSVGGAAVALAKAAMDGAVFASAPGRNRGFCETLWTAVPIHHLSLPELVVKGFFFFAILILFCKKKIIS